MMEAMGVCHALRPKDEIVSRCNRHQIFRLLRGTHERGIPALFNAELPVPDATIQLEALMDSPNSIGREANCLVLLLREAVSVQGCMNRERKVNPLSAMPRPWIDRAPLNFTSGRQRFPFTADKGSTMVSPSAAPISCLLRSKRCSLYFREAPKSCLDERGCTM